MELLLPIYDVVNVVKHFEFTFQYGATSTIFSSSFSDNPPLFTFQYGATSTIKFNNYKIEQYKFTFQYGATSTNVDFIGK